MRRLLTILRARLAYWREEPGPRFLLDALGLFALSLPCLIPAFFLTRGLVALGLAGDPALMGSGIVATVILLPVLWLFCTLIAAWLVRRLR